MERNPVIGGRCRRCGLYHADKIGPCPNRPSLSPEQVLINPPKVPGTVEDSHAALAAEIREAKTLLHRGDLSPSHFTEWAARVEQLGQNFANALKEHDSEFRQRRILEAEREAREAEIAKVRAALIELADVIEDKEAPNTVRAALKREAARLGGTP